MGNKIPVLTNTTNQLLLITEILTEYNLQDLKWKILYSIPETEDVIDNWLFIQNHLHKISKIYRTCQTFESIEKMVLNISDLQIVNEQMYFNSMGSFMNYFDICVYVCKLYFDILGNIAFKIEFTPQLSILKPRNFKIMAINFANIYKNIIENGDNYKLLNYNIEIPINLQNKPGKIAININECDTKPREYVGLFNKIKNSVLEYEDEDNQLAHKIKKIGNYRLAKENYTVSVIFDEEKIELLT